LPASLVKNKGTFYSISCNRTVQFYWQPDYRNPNKPKKDFVVLGWVSEKISLDLKSTIAHLLEQEDLWGVKILVNVIWILPKGKKMASDWFLDEAID
jgi:hypothetical protein